MLQRADVPSATRARAALWRSLSCVLVRAARRVRAAPGFAPLLGLPEERIASVSVWAQRARETLDWCHRGEWGPHYRELRPAELLVKQPPNRLAGPRGAVPDWPDTRPYHSYDPVWLASIPGGCVIGPDGVVVTPDNRILAESAWGNGWLEQHPLLRTWRRPKYEQLPGATFTIASPVWSGYSHCLLEVLPRLALLEAAEGMETRVLVSSPPAGWQREALELFGLADLTLEPLGVRSIECELLHLPAQLGRPGHAHPLVREWLQARTAAVAPNAAAPRRLYVTRRLAQRRRVRNEVELEPLLQDYGFSIVETERMSFTEQVRLFKGAGVVVGAHGAGLASLVFAPAGCRVVELFAPTCIRWMYYELCQVCRHQYGYVVGTRAHELSPFDFDTGCHDLTVDPGDLRSALRQAIGQTPCE